MKLRRWNFLIILLTLKFCFVTSNQGFSKEGIPFEPALAIDTSDVSLSARLRDCRALLRSIFYDAASAPSWGELQTNAQSRETYSVKQTKYLRLDVANLISILRKGDFLKLTYDGSDHWFLIEETETFRIHVVNIDSFGNQKGFIPFEKLVQFLDSEGKGALYLRPDIPLERRAAFMDAAFSSASPAPYLLAGTPKPRTTYKEAAEADGLRFVSKHQLRDEMLNLRVGDRIRYYIFETCELVDATVFNVDFAINEVTLVKDKGATITLDLENLKESEIYLPTLLVSSPIPQPEVTLEPTPIGHRSSNAEEQIETNFSGITDKNSKSSLKVGRGRVSVRFQPYTEAESENPTYSIKIPVADLASAYDLFRRIIQSYNDKYPSISRLKPGIDKSRFDTGFIEGFFRDNELTIIFHRGRGERRYAERLLLVLEEQYGLKIEIAIYQQLH